ncbi:EAL domain-containing protein (putative c-di-GMP-specific phosphodiesterase class I) [Mycetocola sp. CAN_C7]|uniref:putative bifunctional diguanylate cyclase/phosphodiesterase n=1 Tax=Mycetocola sp. CAN_C7 TaxID=2787724 RepID=UPI0018CB1901
MTIETDLEGAVERNEIVAYFQPQVDVRTGRVAAFEALARWQHPTRGLVPPVDFIPVAERTGLIGEIGTFMLEEGSHHAARWHSRGLAVDVSVNVSAVQLATDDLFDRLHELLVEYVLPDGTLTIEITESELISDPDTVAARLRLLKAFGLGISLDDFGTGRSSLSQLRDLPITELKIDRLLIQEGTHDGALVAVAVELLQERGVRVVAEGVETAEHLERVRSLHCDRAQGYLFGRPMPVDEVDVFLAQAFA